MKQEFNVGDIVTFRPYNEAIPAKIAAIEPGERDGRIFYQLTGVHPQKPVISTCTGKCIIESKYYQEEVS